MTVDLRIRAPKGLPTGAVVSACVLKDIITKAPGRRNSPWIASPYGFVLSRPRILTRPVPLLGRLGLYSPYSNVSRRGVRHLASQSWATRFLLAT